MPALVSCADEGDGKEKGKVYWGKERCLRDLMLTRLSLRYDEVGPKAFRLPNIQLDFSSYMLQRRAEESALEGNAAQLDSCGLGTRAQRQDEDNTKAEMDSTGLQSSDGGGVRGLL
jgi:hypothetical protein